MSSVRQRIEEMKERNKAIAKERTELMHKTIAHTDNQIKERRGIKELVDRAKFVVVASCKNPGPISQYAPGLTCGMDPHEVYVTSSGKVKAKAFKMLHREAAQEAVASGTMAPIPAEPRQRVTERPLVSNFSPNQGVTMSYTRGLDSSTLLGLRSTLHWTATRRPLTDGPGTLNRTLNPPEGEWRAQRKTAAWLAREGNPDLSRNRMHISRLCGRASSSPSL